MLLGSCLRPPRPASDRYSKHLFEPPPSRVTEAGTLPPGRHTDRVLSAPSLTCKVRYTATGLQATSLPADVAAVLVCSQNRVDRPTKVKGLEPLVGSMKELVAHAKSRSVSAQGLSKYLLPEGGSRDPDGSADTVGIRVVPAKDGDLSC
ncbi:hypothetical protein WJX73_004311 [Symbiochloris irregularis]|uniref:Uncharacterized protein n=1 Tax=Symbiochloris irregularis TaxID=706552 RepID=A0AAW1NZT8_9CHLO